MKRLLLPFVLFVAGCAPDIGDACEISTDCSQGGERLCDVASPGGYCTVFDCEAGKCPEEGSCVVFGASPSTVMACSADPTGSVPSQRSFCMLTCEDSSDCRQAEGYVCTDPTTLGATNVDGAGRKVCMFGSPASQPKPTGPGEVCIAETPMAGAGGGGGGGGGGSGGDGGAGGDAGAGGDG
jgi:hypothetical protein